ncbi:MAG: hypothetical protein ABI921_00525 [Panacibacter sp.]
MKQQSKLAPALVIYTMVLGKKNYIADYSEGMDTKRRLKLHTDVAEAIPFITESEITDFLSNIINPLNRVYLTENVMVPAESLKPVKLKKQS